MNRCPYDNQPGSEKPLYEHLQRSIQYTLDRLGPHGLPLIGRADWNDCLNLNCFSDTPGQSFQTTTNKDGKVAESVFIAGLFVLAAKEMADIARKAGQGPKPRPLTLHFRTSRWKKHSLEPLAGMAIGSGGPMMTFGEPVGSSECKEGQIFIEPQGMCVMAGWAWRMAGPGRRWIRSPNTLATPNTGLSCCNRLISNIICTWVRSPPTRPDTKKTAASSATPIRGS